MLSSVAARLGLALTVGLWFIGSPVFAAGGHDHGHAHGPAKSAKTGVSSVPQVTASSEQFELVGVLRDGRLNIRLTGKADKAVVKDARVEVAVDGETSVAAPQPDGGYLLQTAALAKPGDHEIIATITVGKTSDLLVGTLAAVGAGDAFDHNHAAHHGPNGDVADTRLVSLARRPLIALGVGFALVALGLAAGLRISGRPSRLARPLVAGALVMAAASLATGMVQNPTKNPKLDAHAEGNGHKHGEGDEQEGVIKMPADRIAAAKITIEAAGEGTLSRRLTVPGVIIPDANRQARVPAQVVGTVAEMKKRVGDSVERGEIIAIISSREVADAKSEYLAAVVNQDLQKTLYERSAALWEKRVTPEQQFLQVKATYAQAQLRVDLARQKLSSLGLDAKVVAQEAKEDGTAQGPSRLRSYEVRAPIAGRIVERKVDVGAPVGKEGDASELYAIADLTAVWTELAVPIGDLDTIKDGQAVAIGNTEKSAEGKIVFVSPIVNAETRSARVIAAFDNANMTWRPGTFVTARIALDQQEIGVRVPRTALQKIEGKQVVFARTAAGFEKREVTLGKSDEDAVEVVAGLAAGEAIAVGNTFLLKAELGKAEAEHSH